MNVLLQHLAAEQAERRPEARAVVMGDDALTYAELEGAGNRLARALREAGCAWGDRVCVVMPKSPAAIVAVLGVLKAGGIYVPLDPASPAPRLATMIAACDTRWILAAGPLAPAIEALFVSSHFRRTIAIGWLGRVPPPPGLALAFREADLAGQSDAALPCATSAHDPAHILFTSGSTGVPKGVVIRHANVLHFVRWAVRHFGTAPGDRISGHPPLFFDLSGFDMFGTFAAGAELHLIPPELNVLPHKLAELIRREALTQWFSVPSLLNYMAKFDVVRDGDFPSLKRVLWCGETFPTPSLMYWMRRVPHATFTNLYGPTETTIASSYCTVERCPESEDEVVPIGRACPGEELLVLDEAMRPVPVGEPGDLYIGGAGLAVGYWRDPDQTRKAFVPDPRPGDGQQGRRLYRTGDLASVRPDGQVVFLGRRDSQIKSRGYRIELGEIEAALNAVGTLRECAVVAVPSRDFNGTTICCAYVPVPGAQVTPASLRDAAARCLPTYMIPSRWWAFDALPKTANGKIDRRVVRERFTPEPTTAGS